MADRLILRDVVVSCRIGVSIAEQAAPQDLWIDLDLEIDAARSAVRDDVREAIDYAALVSAVQLSARDKAYHLLETLAEDLAALVLQQFPTEEVVVRVKKRALAGIDYAAVEITRRR